MILFSAVTTTIYPSSLGARGSYQIFTSHAYARARLSPNTYVSGFRRGDVYLLSMIDMKTAVYIFKLEHVRLRLVMSYVLLFFCSF